MNAIGNAPLHTPHGAQAAHPDDVRGLARPRRNRARARDHDDLLPGLIPRLLDARPIREQELENFGVRAAEPALRIHEMHETRIEPGDLRVASAENSEKFGNTKRGKSGRALDLQHVYFSSRSVSL